MRSNYKSLGEHIRLVKVKNTDDSVKELLGINIDKFFMPSVANIVGTDLSKYQIVQKNQFACNRMHVGRDYRIPVAKSNSDSPFIVSPAYDVFEIIDESILLPDYLMLWFKRREFDRNAWFYTDADVRGGLHWKAFIEIKLPIPSPEKQKELIEEYEAVEDRIQLNKKLCATLEETAQTIYKHWFEDFEFPDKQGKPYKSSGGEMGECEELGKEIPKGWRVGKFFDLVILNGGGTPSTNNSEFWSGNIPFFTPKDCGHNVYTISTEKNLTSLGLKNCSSKLYDINTCFVTARGTVGNIALAGEKMGMNQSCYALLGKTNEHPYFIHQLSIKVIEKLKKQAVGAVFSALVTSDFNNINISIPENKVIDQFENFMGSVYEKLLTVTKQNQKLEELKSLLLGKMAVEV